MARPVHTIGCLVFVTACIFISKVSSASELKIDYLDTPQCQRKTKNGDYLSVHYRGTLEETGEQFDSSIDRGTPFEFELGNSEVIKGWDQGMQDMCIGEKRRLTVPPHLGYGAAGAGEVIPGGATLVFEVELVGIDEPPKENNVFNDIDKDGDKMLSQDEVSMFVREQEEKNTMSPQEEREHEKMIAEVFEHEDADKDGFISLEEFSGPKDEL